MAAVSSAKCIEPVSRDAFDEPTWTPTDGPPPTCLLAPTPTLDESVMVNVTSKPPPAAGMGSLASTDIPPLTDGVSDVPPLVWYV